MESLVRKILIIEDNPSDIELIGGLLSRKEGAYTLRAADRLSSGLGLLTEERFDVVLLDLGLPDSRGIDSLRKVQDRSPNLPIIVLTGFADEELAERAKSLGAQDYLVKGKIDSDMLHRSISYSIERRRVEVAMKRESRRTELILSTAGEGILGLDREGTITFINNAGAAMFGYRADEMIGKNCLVMYHHSAPDGVPYPAEKCPIDAAFRQGVEHNGEEAFWRKDGTSFPVEFTSRPLYEENRIVGAVATFRDITERKRAEGALRASERQYRTLFNAIDEGFCIIEVIFNENKKPIDYRFLEVNPSFERQTGLISAQGKRMRELAPKHEEHWFEIYGKIAMTGQPARFQNRAEQLHRWYDVYAFRFGLPENRHVAILFNDITGQKQNEDRLKRAKVLSDELNKISRLVHSTFNVENIILNVLEGAARAMGVDGASTGIFERNSRGLSIRYIYNVPESLRKRCCSPEEAKGIQYVAHRKDAFAFNDIATDERVNPQFWKAFGFSAMLAAPLMIQEEVIGTIMFYSKTRFLFDDMHIDFARKLGASLSLAFDNARLYEEQKQMEENMREMAHHDSLTGLPNRRLFLDIMNEELKQAARRKNKMAILFLDLDRFKEVNDTLGHEAGDLLLKQAASRLEAVVRKSDTMARIGGDEFNLILADLARPEDSTDIAEKIIRSFQKPFKVAGRELRITTSIGISIYPDDSKDVDALLRYADIAMYHAKENGRNKYRFYNASINLRSLEWMRLESMLRRSLELDEMVLYYQPLVDIQTLRIECAEALARWRHPQKGLLEAKDFIPAAEETGFIKAIDEWSLKTVCKQIRSWMDAGDPPVCVTVNLSARQFQDTELVRKISSIVKETGIPPGCLDLEITETIAMADVERSVARLRDLTKMGVDISIDDFGTGYSSLNYLRRLPIERLKIDRSFVQDIANDSDDRSIVQAVTAMAHSMKMKVVAEGVETEEQLEFLRKTGCDEAQGVLFCNPVPADIFGELISGKR